MKHSNFFKSMLLMLCLLTASGVEAASWPITVVNGIYYEAALIGDDYLATVLPYNNNSSDSHQATYVSGDVTIPSSITYNGRTYPVNEVQFDAFKGCKNLKSISLPVSNLGSSAFQNCTSLTSVTITGTPVTIDPYCFAGCTSLKSITLPASVKVLNKGAFQDCTSLSSITMEGMVNIGDSAFLNCTSLSLSTLPATVTIIGNKAFSNTGITDFTLPAGVATVGTGMFSNSKLTSFAVNSPSTSALTSIPAETFSGCSALTSVSIPKTVTSIGVNAFHQCTALQGISLPSSVTVLPKGAFSGCTQLAQVNAPGLRSIMEDAFANCSLNYITLPSTLMRIGTNAFRYSDISTIDIPAGVIIISTGAFSHCSNLSRITVASDNPNYTSVDGVLYNKAKTTLLGYPSRKGMTFKVPEGVTTLEADVFNGAKMTSLTLPATLTQVNSAALANMTLDTLTCLSTSVPSTVSNVYSGSTIKTLVVPDAALSAYKANANWSSMASKIISASQAALGAAANLVYKVFDEDKSTAYVTYAGDNDTYPDIDTELQKTYVTGNLTIPSTCTINGKTYTVTTIENAFSDCTGLTSVTLPSTITDIFMGAFVNCTSLATINIPTSVTRVETDAFTGSLWWNNQPDGLVYINTIAYQYKGKKPDKNNLFIKDGTTVIGDECFKGQTNMTTLRFLPASLTEIGVRAFQKSGLTIAALPTYFHHLSAGTGMFEDCKDLTIAYLPDEADAIPDAMFRNCTALTRVDVKGITRIGIDAFNGCKALTHFALPSTVTLLQDRSFANSGITSFYVPLKVKLSPYVFADCKNLKTVDLPDTLTDLPNHIFERDSALTTVNVGKSLQIIRDYAFVRCCIDSLRLPATLKTLNANAFKGATIKALHCAATTVPVADSTAFDNSTITLYVPKGMKAAYKVATGWSRIANILEEGETATVAGDANGDGIVSSLDVVAVANTALGNTIPGFITAAADMNGDGSITSVDLVGLCNKILSGGGAARRIVPVPFK